MLLPGTLSVLEESKILSNSFVFLPLVSKKTHKDSFDIIRLTI